MGRDAFGRYHPLVNFFYFFCVLVFSVVFSHPVMELCSLLGGLGYACLLRGRRAAGLALRFLLPLGVAAMVLSPLFNHEGATILCWLPGGNPLTLESILAGAGSAVMLVSAVLWFSCVSDVLTSDKFVWLFGRIIPALSLVLSMALRFVPRFSARLREVSRARRGAGYGGKGGVPGRVREGLAVFSIVVTWALENAVETADSMKSRGYGLPGRTAFSNYRWESRDSTALLFLLFCGGYVAVGGILGGAAWRYYPVAGGEMAAPFSLSIFAAWLALCLMPLYLAGREAYQWRSMVSGI